MTRMPRIKRVDKLIATHVLGSLLVVWLVLVGFDTVSHFAQELGDLGKNGYGLAQAVIYISLTVPRRAYDMFGFAALIGSLIGLGGLAASNELTALRASGMSRARIMMSTLAAVILVMLAVSILGETAGPAGEQRAQALRLSLRSNQLGLTTRSGLWARDGESIVNAKGARVLQRNGRPQIQLADVRVFGLDKAGVLKSFTTAGMAMYRDGAWQLDKVRVTRFDDQGAHSSQHDSMPWQSRLDPKMLELSVVDPDYMSLRDLKRNIRYFRANGQNPGSYANAWWARIFYPLNVLLLVLAVLPLAFGNLRSGGLGQRIFTGIIVSVAWYFLQLSVVSLGNVYGLLPWLSNLLPAILLAVIALAHYRRTA